MIKRDLAELPAMACGVYVREVAESGEQDFSYVMMPYAIDVYLGEEEDADALYVKALKWGNVLDLFVERYGSSILPGYYTDEAPDIDISYVLELRDGSYRQLVTAIGVLASVE
jgi:hypothetical protein